MFDFNLYVRTKPSCVIVKNRATANLSLTRFQIHVYDVEIPLHNLWTFLHLIFLRPIGAAIDFKLEHTNMN